jgi:hypothetical protein
MQKFYEDIMEYIKSIKFDDLEAHYAKCASISNESDEIKNLFYRSSELENGENVDNVERDSNN